MPQVAAISQQIWDMKYRLKAPDGTPVDKTIEDTWRAGRRARWPRPERRASARLGGARSTRRWRISSSCRRAASWPAPAPGAASRCSTASSWATIPDDMGGIFAHLREAALTMQQGGGIGYDFSTLRPKGAPVKGVGADASGPALLHGCVGRHVPHHHDAPAHGAAR